jgi:hypothetical protein
MKLRRIAAAAAIVGSAALATVAVPGTAQAAVSKCSSTWIAEGGKNIGVRGVCGSGTGSFYAVVGCLHTDGYKYSLRGSRGYREESGGIAKVKISFAYCSSSKHHAIEKWMEF